LNFGFHNSEYVFDFDFDFEINSIYNIKIYFELYNLKFNLEDKLYFEMNKFKRHFCILDCVS